MKKIFALLVVLAFLLITPSLGAKEDSKVLTIEGVKNFYVEVPEKAPDVFKFKSQILAMKEYENGNKSAAIEFMNESLTVDVILLMVKINGKIHVLAMQVSYCPEGFDKFNEKIEHLTEYYQDEKFVKTGKASNKLTRVKNFADASVFEKYLEGQEI